MKKITVTAPINNLSYGIVSRNVIKNLSKKALVGLKPIQMDVYYQEEFKEFVDNYYLSFGMNDPSLIIFHENLIMDHQGKGPRIAFPFFEKNQFDFVTKFNIKNQDLVLTASKWGENIIRAHGQENVKVVNIGVDDDFNVIPCWKNKDKISFITIGKYEKRKGHDILPLLFAEAFQGIDDVELIAMIDNPFMTAENMGQVKADYRKIMLDKVKFVGRITKKNMIQLINTADIGLFLSRAEGWNMPLLECMACGKDIVATNYSAHTEYLPDMDGVFKINPTREEEAYDGVWFFGGFSWMDLSDARDQIIEQLRAAYKKQKEKREANYELSRYARRYTWENTAKEILGVI